MRRILWTAALGLALALFLMPGTVRGAEAASGSCGPETAWSFDAGTGTLTISGRGPMEDYTAARQCPWADHAANVRRVVLGDNVTSVGAYAFKEHDSLAEVEFGLRTAAVGDCAFANCAALTSLKLFDSVTSIGSESFAGTGLTEAVLPRQLRSMGENAFQDAIHLEYVDFPNTLTEIPAGAFMRTGLKEVEIPSEVVSIGTGAFHSCTSLQRVVMTRTSADGAAESMEIGPYAFTGCTNLQSVYLPEGLADIPGQCFRGCTGLAEVDIPSGVTSLGADAFSGCTALKHVTLPEGLAEIGAGCFAGSGLEGVEIPASVRAVHAGAFSRCQALKAVAFAGDPCAIAEDALNGVPEVQLLYHHLNSAWPSAAGSTYGAASARWRPCIPGTSGGMVLEAKSSHHTLFAPGGGFTLTFSMSPAHLSEDLEQVKQNVHAEGYELTGLERKENAWELTFTPLPENPRLAEFPLTIDGGAFLECYWENGRMVREPSYTRTVQAHLVWAPDAEILWDDGEDAQGERPEWVELELAGEDGEVLGTRRVSAAESWRCSWDCAVEEVAALQLRVKDASRGLTDYQVSQELADGAWKLTFAYQPKSPEEMAVVAVWADGGDASLRPSSVTVRVLTDGTPETEAVLSEANSWRCTLTKSPEDERIWTVQPEEVLHYTYGIEEIHEDGGGYWKVTYTLEEAPPDEPDPDNPDPVDPDEPDPDNPDPDDPDNPDPDNPDPPKDPDPPKNPDSSRPSRPSGGTSRPSGKKPDSAETKPAEKIPFYEIVTPPSGGGPSSPIQGSVKTGGTYPDWADRISLPDYAKTLYDVLVEGSRGTGSALADSLIREDSFTLDPQAGDREAAGQVLWIEAADFSLTDAFGSVSPLGSGSFDDGAFYTVNAAAGDRWVDYGALQLGDVVRTPSFNGIFVTRTDRGSDFDAVKKEACAYISAAFQAFDRDHPEVFWLSGKCKVRMIAVQRGGVQEVCFFLVLADKDFTMLAPAWQGSGAVAQGIRRREAAVERILASVTADAADARVRQLNECLTWQNEYNTSADLTAIGNEPHECLSALEGRTGTSGPVCDGYARAFKVLCDRLGIPCVLETGYAKTTPGGKGGFHMWNSVQVGQRWYGVDITWNDPQVKGVSGARSGYENERFLLVGSSTEILGMAFSVSHPVSNQAAAGGVLFSNGPALSPVAYSPLLQDPEETAGPEAAETAEPGPETTESAGDGGMVLSFPDVTQGDAFAEAVEYVCRNGLMRGDGQGRFQPNAGLTCRQAWAVLFRLGGQKPASMAEVEAWARSRGVSGGGEDPAAVMTRQQMAVFLYRCRDLAGCDPDGSMDLNVFSDGASTEESARDAVSWAAAQGILTASGDQLSPEKGAARWQLAVALTAFCGA